MPTADDFLRAIIAAPDADGPRLAYADWLEEGGDAERAEFIRVQCALAALPENEREFHPLRERERELKAQRRSTWLEPFDRLLGPARPWSWRRWLSRSTPWHASFRRGFVEILSLGLDEFLPHADALSRMTPLRELNLIIPSAGATRDHAVHRLAACPQLAGLSALRISIALMDADEFRRLIECPALESLRELSLACDLEPACIPALRRSPLLDHLDRLKLLDIARIGDEGIILLVENLAERGLQELALTNSGLTSDGLIDLTALRLPPRLVKLSLAGSRLGDTSLSLLPPWLQEPTDLDLSHTGLGPGAADSLARSLSLRRLAVLNLSGNAIDDVGALALADSRNLFASTRVVLSGNPISDRVKNALRVRFGDQFLV